MFWQTTRFRIDLARPQVMGIVNATPDSFFDGGRHVGPVAALRHCERLLREGADVLDIGGESTRPGAAPASVDEELARVLPVLRGALTLGCPLSVDTQKPEVMRAALELGVDIINDVQALQLPGALSVVREHAACGVCLMHMRGTPQSMQVDTSYVDVVGEVGDFLLGRKDALVSAGVSAERLVFDPGIGFAKTAAQNLELLRRQGQLAHRIGPLLVGWSRKSTLGVVTGRPADERLGASVAAALLSVQAGARIVRVHDVAPTVDALKMWAMAAPALPIIAREETPAP